MESVFTKIIKRELPARIIWENKEAICIIPKEHFVNPGHILLIPKIEIDYIFDLDDSLYLSLWKLAKKIAKPLKKVTKAKRIGIAVEGFSVPHVHIHLCPLYNPSELDPHRGMSWSEEEKDSFLKVMREELECQI